MTSQFDLGPLPKRITGGCLCGKIRYEIQFPDNHDFRENVGDMYPSFRLILISLANMGTEWDLPMHPVQEEHLLSVFHVAQGPLRIAYLDIADNHHEQVLLHRRKCPQLLQSMRFVYQLAT